MTFAADKPLVMIVDDDPLVLNALETTVSEAGYRVNAFGDPRKALKCLSETTIGVIIADQRMDPIPGLELLQQARKLQPNASRILITGFLSVSTLTEAVNCGEIYRFIAKPWSTPELIATLHNAAQRYRLLHDTDTREEERKTRIEELVAEKEQLEVRISQASAARHPKVAADSLPARHWDERFQMCDAVLSAFDPMLAVRTRKTVEICREVARAARLSEEMQSALIASAWFHDLGFISLPREKDERGGVHRRDHPAVSERIAIQSGMSQMVTRAVRAHHESFDGSGYPDRLSGSAIPEIARWLTPIAYFVSSSSTRQEALEELEKLAGIAFDPAIVPHVLKVVLSVSSNFESIGTKGRELVLHRAYAASARR
jgi:response regulator RpfG family c-di-GMP phosphodiesterase